MAHDERRSADLLDDVGHGEGFAGAGDAEQGLVAIAGADGFDEFCDGLALIALRGVFGVEAEGGHGGGDTFVMEGEDRDSRFKTHDSRFTTSGLLEGFVSHAAHGPLGGVVF